MASGRRLPDLMCEVMGARNSKIAAASPLFAAVTTSPVALYGTIWKLVPVTDLKSSAARCCVLPMPMVPTFSLPGFFFASATRSFTLLWRFRVRHDDQRKEADGADHLEVALGIV